ncbi:MAG TPA: ATP-binding protein [Gammaproteobacteria bacterium]|nr:ATP-binding protein [Gammaproteobacteria bacterium]
MDTKCERDRKTMPSSDDYGRLTDETASSSNLENQLKALQDDFNSLSRNLAAAAVFLDSERRVRRYTAGAAAVMALSEGDIGRPIDEISASVPAVEMKADIAAALTKGVPHEREIKSDDGRWYRRRISAGGAGDAPDGVVISFVDVTHQQELNATLDRRVRERMRTLELLRRVATTVNSSRSVDAAFQEVIDAVCEYLGWPIGHAYAVPPVHDSRFGHMDIWSRRAQQHYPELVTAWRSSQPRPGEGLLGVVAMPESAAWAEVNELQGLLRRAVTLPNFKPELALMMPVRVGRRTVAMVEFYRPSGGARHEAVLPLIDQIGSDLGYIVERQQLEFRTLRQQRGLSQITRLAVIGEMAGSIAHQLNQPLTAILNYIAAARRVLEHEAPESTRMVKICGSIDEQAHRAADYISHMRDFARRQQPRLKLLDVHQPLESAIALVMPAARTASIAMETEFDRHIPWAYVDAMQLEQVFIGLLMNAIEAMEEVEIGDRIIEVESRRMGDDRIRLTIRDHGHGIPDDLIEYIFDPFFSTREGSIGMGLSVGRSIIEAFGGRIEAEIVAPHGVRFHVDLPIEREAQRQGEEEIEI